MAERVIAGTWTLKTWRRIADDGSFHYPFGEHPRGILVYAPDGSMAVQMEVAERPRLDTDDPLGGDVEQRAGAYSTFLSYFGTWELRDDRVVHRVDGASFPNWSDTVQERPFVFEGETLVLQVKTEQGRVTNEILWDRKR